MFKKIFLVLICIPVLLCSCSSEPQSNPSDASQAPPSVIGDVNYMGEGKLTVLRGLISAHATIINEIYTKDVLPIDKTATVTISGKTYAKVKSDKFTDYATFESYLFSVYTEDVIKSLPQIYINHEGALYRDVAAKGSSYLYDWSGFTVKSVKNGNDISVLEVTLKTIGGDETKAEISFTFDNGSWKLDSYYLGNK